MEIFNSESVVKVNQLEVRTLIIGIQLYLENLLRPRGSNEESSGATLSDFQSINHNVFELLKSLYSISGLVGYYESFLEMLCTKYNLRNDK